MQNRSGMLDCGFKRCQIGSRLKCSKVGALKDQNFVIEARRREAFRSLAMCTWPRRCVGD